MTSFVEYWIADAKDPATGLPIKMEYPHQHNGGASAGVLGEGRQDLDKMEVCAFVDLFCTY